MTDPVTEPFIVRMRRADPAAAMPTPTEAEIDAALARMLAMTRAAPPRRSRWQTRGPAVLVAAAAAAAVIVFVLLPMSRPGSAMLSGQEARMILRGAAARLASAPGRVLHTVSTDVQGGRGRTLDRVRVETWSQTTRPYDNRIITSPQGSRPWELANIDGREQLFDARRDTIYTGDAPPHYTVRRLADGRYRLTTHHYTPGQMTITAAQLRALRADRDTIVPAGAHMLQVIPFRAMERQPIDLRTDALAILHSAHPDVRRVRFDGRAAIEVTGPGQIPRTRNRYYVAPHTYTPLGLVIALGDGAYVREHYTIYKLLAGGPAAVRRLVTLSGAHPHAHVDSSPAAFNKASERLIR